MWQIKSYNDMFQAIRALTVQNIIKIRILSPNSSKMKAFSRFVSNALIKIVFQEKIQIVFQEKIQS